MAGESNSGKLQMLIQAGAVGICFALIALIYQSNDNERRQTEKMTELVEVTRSLGPTISASITEVAADKTSDVIAAVQSSCACSRPQ